MKYKQLKKIALYISKEYSDQIFHLLLDYKDISASEAASRLDLHIKTVQDFLEALSEAEIINCFEVNEGKRPYKRYSLTEKQIMLNYDLTNLKNDAIDSSKNELCIRELKDARVRFNIARDKKSFSSVVIWIGKGRNRQERKISLTSSQGKFLYNLPFPTAEFETIRNIMIQSNIDKSYEKELVDIVNVLIDLKVIEVRS